MSAIHEPSFQGIVRYTLAKSVSGEDVLEAKWVSTRIATKHIAPGTGYAVRKSDGQANAWLGDWENVYVEPDGKAFPMDFGMNLTADGDIYHGRWTTPDGNVLTGFGFEDDGKLYMRYGK